jgi:hypothetical protein
MLLKDDEHECCNLGASMFDTDGRAFRTFLSLCIALAGVLAAAPEARADASISVDASTVLQVSQGDDLATLQNIFQEANMPADGSTRSSR